MENDLLISPRIWQRLSHSTTPFTRLFAVRVQQAFEMAAQDLVLLLQQQIEQQRIMMERQDQRHQEQLQAILAMARKSEENEPIKTFTFKGPLGNVTLLDTKKRQTCQLSRFCRETRGFACFLQVSRFFVIISLFFVVVQQRYSYNKND